MLEVTPVAAFRDNYIWLIHAPGDRRQVVVVDPGDARPVLEALKTQALRLAAVFITHHHPDHVGGVGALLARQPVPVYGPGGERIAGLTHRLAESDRVSLTELGLTFDVLEVPGHTAGHIAYFGHGALFCGDTLFVAGCGRLFEGTPEQMTASLAKLKGLPPETRVYCAHEYTLSNLRFARAVEPANEALVEFQAQAASARERQEPTVPTTIGMERAINPFLRCDVRSVRAAAEAHAGRGLTTESDVFAVVRGWKDEF